MDLKLAKKDPNDAPSVISLSEIERQVEEKGGATFYLDKDNSIKDLQKMRAHFEKGTKSVHFNELRFGLDKDCFIYELHIINY